MNGLEMQGFLYLNEILHSGWQLFAIKGLLVNILGFVGHIRSGQYILCLYNPLKKT